MLMNKVGFFYGTPVWLLRNY